MSAISKTTQRAVTMSSSEIAELTGKQHSHVIRDIRETLGALKDDPDLDHPREDKDSRGYTVNFHLGRELTEILLVGYSIPLRVKVIRRLHELEMEINHQSPALPQTFAEALRLAADQQEQIEKQQAQLAIAAPKAEFVDKYVDSTGLKGFRQVAKLLGAKENELREFLVDSKIQYRLGGEWCAYQNHIDAGRFQVRTGTSNHSDHVYNEAKFTPKGVAWLAGLWAQHNLRFEA